jgi:hypothetical protein
MASVPTTGTIEAIVLPLNAISNPFTYIEYGSSRRTENNCYDSCLSKVASINPRYYSQKNC